MQKSAMMLDQPTLPLSRIRTSGFNPRRFSDPVKMAELLAGIRAVG